MNKQPDSKKNQQPSFSSSSASDAVQSNTQSSRSGHESRDVRAKAGEAVSKHPDVAQQGASQAKQTASSLASDANQKAKGVLNHQVASRPDLAGPADDSARSADDTRGRNA